MIWLIQQTADLSRGDDAGARRQAIEPIAYPGDQNAHKWRVTVLDGGVAADLTGYTVSAEFERIDGTRVPATQRSITGNVVEVTLPPNTYAIPGIVRGIMQIVKTGTTLSLCAIAFTVRRAPSGTVIDPSGEITLNVAQLIADIAECESSLDAIDAAAEAANEAAAAATAAATAGDNKFVRFDTAQTLTAAQKTQARENIGATGSDTSTLEARIAALENEVADLSYAEMAISAFTANPAVAEIGSTVSAVTLAYAMNKVPESATLDGSAWTITAASGTIALTGLSLTGNKTWTLTATDERDETASKAATLSFLNRAYWGAAAAPETVDSTFLLALSNSALTGSRTRTFSVTAGEEQYIWYAVPSRFGACTFNVKGFDGGFTKVAMIGHTNASGYTENYDVYRSDNAKLGDTSVVVT